MNNQWTQAIYRLEGRVAELEAEILALLDKEGRMEERHETEKCVAFASGAFVMFCAVVSIMIIVYLTGWVTG